MSRDGNPAIIDPEGFKERLIQARQNAGLTQRDLAFPGCSAVYICRLEKGDRRFPSLEVLNGLARRLGVTPEWLLTGKDDPLFTTIREIILEYHEGADIPRELIDKLDELTRPDWYERWEWWKLSGGGLQRRPKGIPKPVPVWARRLYRVFHPYRV